jgi:hypothetical protein
MNIELKNKIFHESSLTVRLINWDQKRNPSLREHLKLRNNKCGFHCVWTTMVGKWACKLCGQFTNCKTERGGKALKVSNLELEIIQIKRFCFLKV